MRKHVSVDENVGETKKMRTVSLKNILLVLVALIAMVCVWRGVWGLQDMYLFPERPDFSFVLSICIGLTLIFLFFGKKLFKVMFGG